MFFPRADTLTGVTASLETQVLPIMVHLVPAPTLGPGTDESLTLDVQTQNT